MKIPFELKRQPNLIVILSFILLFYWTMDAKKFEMTVCPALFEDWHNTNGKRKVRFTLFLG